MRLAKPAPGPDGGGGPSGATANVERPAARQSGWPSIGPPEPGLKVVSRSYLRDPERLKIGIGKDAVEELGGQVIPVPCADVIGPHADDQRLRAVVDRANVA
ncbi:hypothetical protein [Streptomyces lydicus]|uniref:hypothetical protein n=1 Tax=Streptomyces lydicus TaxID=47763 RepID=UPI0037996BE6